MTNANEQLKRVDVGNRVKADTTGFGEFEAGTITRYDKNRGYVYFESLRDGEEVWVGRSDALKCSKKEFETFRAKFQEQHDEAVEQFQDAPVDVESEELPGLVEEDEDEQQEVTTASRSIVPQKYRDRYVRNRVERAVYVDCGDYTAAWLRGKTLHQVYETAAELLDLDLDTLYEKYSHLNNGQVRMVLGNRIRKAVNELSEGEEEDGEG